MNFANGILLLAPLALAALRHGDLRILRLHSRTGAVGICTSKLPMLYNYPLHAQNLMKTKRFLRNVRSMIFDEFWVTFRDMPDFTRSSHAHTGMPDVTLIHWNRLETKPHHKQSWCRAAPPQLQYVAVLPSLIARNMLWFQSLKSIQRDLSQSQLHNSEWDDLNRKNIMKEHRFASFDIHLLCVSCKPIWWQKLGPTQKSCFWASKPGFDPVL